MFDDPVSLKKIVALEKIENQNRFGLTRLVEVEQRRRNKTEMNPKDQLDNSIKKKAHWKTTIKA